MNDFSDEERKFSRKSIYLFADCFGVDGSRARIRVRNVSESGLGGQIEGQWSLSKGQKITIAFRDKSPIEGTVAWLERGNVGIEFDKLVPPDELLPGLIVGKAGGLG